MGTMGTINDSQTHARRLFTFLALAALLGAQLITLSVGPAAAEDDKGWTLNRLVLEFDDGASYYDSEESGYIQVGSADIIIQEDDNELHISCSDDLTDGDKGTGGTGIFQGEQRTITDFWINSTNPSDNNVPGDCDPLDEFPTFDDAPDDELTVTVTKHNAAGDNDFGDSNTADAEGDDVDFRVTIDNTGNVAAYVSTFTDTWPHEGETQGFVDLLTDEDVDIDCGEFDLDTDTIPAGQGITCDFTIEGYAPAAGESLTNRVDVTITDDPEDDGSLEDDGDDTSTVDTDDDTPPPPPTPTPDPEDPDADISLVKLVDGEDELTLENPEVGDEVTYTFTITNEDEDDLVQLELGDEIFTGLAEIGDYLDTLFDIEVTDTIEVEGTEDVTLEPGEQLELETVYALTEEDLDRGGIYNVATVAALGDESGDEVSASDDALVSLTFVDDVLIELPEPAEDPPSEQREDPTPEPTEDPTPDDTAVLGEVIEDDEPADEDEVEVAGETEELPRTGVDSDTLLLLGLLLTILGATAVMLSPQRRLDVA